MRTAIVTGLTIVLAVVTNYATQFGPAWTRNPWIVWPVAALLAMLTTVAAVVANRRRAPDPVGPVLRCRLVRRAAAPNRCFP